MEFDEAMCLLRLIPIRDCAGRRSLGLITSDGVNGVSLNLRTRFGRMVLYKMLA